MRLSEGKRFALTALAGFLVYDLLVKPVLLINVEKVAEKLGYADIVARHVDTTDVGIFVKIVEMTISSYYNTFSSGQIFAFLLGGVVVAFSDWLFWPLTAAYRFATRGRSVAPVSAHAANQVVQKPRPSLTVNQSPGPKPEESDREQEAKAKLAQFCRAHLLDLVEYERRMVMGILEGLVGDPAMSVLGPYTTAAVREKFDKVPEIITSIQSASYKTKYSLAEMERALVEANSFVKMRSIFINAGISEKDFDQSKCISNIKRLFDIRIATNEAWKSIVSDSMYNDIVRIGRSDNAWGQPWPPTLT